jgi:hypothetical protein
VVDASNLLTDAAAGTLPAVSWYLPKETEHPPRTACAGENATVKAVDAIMRGPQWRSTAVVVWWDEWGGFYDHVPPPRADGTDGGVTGLNSLQSYGFRVPLLVISPWVKDGPLQNRGYASHVFYSHASFARFIEWAFNLPTLSAADDLSTTRPASRAREPAGLLRLLGLTAEGQGHPAGARLSQADTRPADAGCHRTRRLTSVHSASCRR